MPDNQPPSPPIPPPLPGKAIPPTGVPPLPQPVPPAASKPIPPETVPLLPTPPPAPVARIEMLDKTPAPLLSRARRDASRPEEKKEMIPPLPPPSATSSLPVASVPTTPFPISEKTPLAHVPVKPESTVPSLPVAPVAPISLPENKPEPDPLKNKLPAPLMSRRRTASPGSLETGPAQPAKKISRSLPIWAHVLLRLVLIAAVLGAGYGAYYQFRQTRLEVLIVVSPDFQLAGDAMLVRDFTPDMGAIREDLRLAAGPVQDRLRERSDVLSRVRGDLAGREERKQLLQKEETQLRQDAEKVVTDAQAQAQQLWDQQDATLDAEYKTKLNEFEATIEARAKTLGLTYDKDSDFASPEVWVNAYRLSLYDAPKAVKTGDERVWAEKLLADWHVYEADWDKRKAAVQGQADQFKTVAGTKIQQIQSRIDELEGRVKDTDAEIEPLRQELDDASKQMDQAQTEAAALEGPYYEQLLQIPVKNIDLKLPIGAGGKVSWKHIDRDSLHPPGPYNLWLKGQKNGEEYWALVPFELQPYAETRVTVYEPAFLSVHEFLRRPQ